MQIPPKYSPVMEVSLLNLVEKGYRVINGQGIDVTSEILQQKEQTEKRFTMFLLDERRGK